MFSYGKSDRGAHVSPHNERISSHRCILTGHTDDRYLSISKYKCDLSSFQYVFRGTCNLSYAEMTKSATHAIQKRADALLHEVTPHNHPASNFTTRGSEPLAAHCIHEHSVRAPFLPHEKTSAHSTSTK